MTAELIDPQEGVLLDRRDAFLSGPDFLADNMPEGAPVPTEHANHMRLAVELAAAYMVWRFLSSRYLAQAGPPDLSNVPTFMDRVEKQVVPSWVRLVAPVVENIYGDVGMPLAMREAAAASYAASMGQEVHESSTEALIEGYTSELNRGMTPELAWQRASSAYGLDSQQMRSWLMAQRNLAQTYNTGVHPGAAKALDRALLQRADKISQTEEWSARHVGRSIVWMDMLRREQLPEGTKKRWVTADDERVCPVCGPLHLKQAELNERFDLPDGRKLWAPGVHPNCRCELELVWPESGEMLEKFAGQSDLHVPKPLEVATATPTQRKLMAVKVAEQGTRKQRRKLVATAVTPVIKAQGDDPYDRDRSGHFASKESRRLETLERPVEQPEVQVAPVAVPDIFATTASAVPDLFTAPATDVFAQAATNVFAAANVFTQSPDVFTSADVFAKPKTQTGRTIIIINRRGEMEEQLPDARLMARADWFLSGAGRASAEAALNNRTVEVASRPLGDHFTHRDIGTVLDFDALHDRQMSQAGDRDLPGFAAWTVGDATFHQDASHLLYDGIDDDDYYTYGDDDANAEMFHEQRWYAYEELLQSAANEIPNLSDAVVASIAIDAGRTQDLRDYGVDVLRQEMLDAFSEDAEEFTGEHEALQEAYGEYMLDQDGELRAAEISLQGSLAPDEDGRDFMVVPQLLSFQGVTRADRVAGDDAIRRVHGKYRVANVITHSMTADAYRGGGISLGGGKRGPENPRVAKWQEIVLEPVEDND